MSCAIREMTVSDTDAVAQARVQGWRHAYAGIVPQQVIDGLDTGRVSAGLRDSLPGKPVDRIHLVAEDAGEGVIGWAHFGPYRPIDGLDEPGGAADGGEEPGWGELYAIYVLPAFIGLGVGRALMAATLDGLAARGEERARLWVLRDNAPARRFYERAGFRPDGAENVLDMDGVPVTEVRYARTLAGTP
ncbi:GNAT family N-acetyltransferase [Streptomyces sp. 6N223]|uniref:GNAT family N-acetyltransferase n=1 Tax=Streptomyces sp. 6N223 TaxID=3457412 RepID=UPI003FD0FE93